MPTYEYVCSKCGQEFEKFQPIAEQPLKFCPRELCPRKRWGKGRVKRVIGAGAGLIFKGSGFYITDYRSDNYKESARKESGDTVKGGDSKTTPDAGKKPAPSGESAPGKPKPAAD